ncbi:EthD domain-containing protein [Xenorhabdus stockiae]|uniref:EthD domain-containing protein n=1 Tax=Xenorhabdus stockiae TaxID=351614 RepID=UPI003CE92655
MANYVEEQLIRPPYIKARPGTHEPLIVLCSFLSRADNTPLSERSRADGHILDHDGNVIPDPSASPSDNAFEGKPNINFEHWGEYWRKVHGVRFIHPETDVDANILEKLVRYDQLHRLAAGPTGTDTIPYRIPVDECGKLWPTVIGHIESYNRPSWDGIAYLNFSKKDDIPFLLSSERVIKKILPEDKVIFRDIAPLLSKQYIVIPSECGNEGVILVKTHQRRSNIERTEFQKWWLEEYAPELYKRNEERKIIKRYVQLHNIGPSAEGQPFYHEYTSSLDGVSLLSFSNINDLEDYLRSPLYQDLANLEAEKNETTEYWTSTFITLVNRIYPEYSTYKDK